jgi:hypothetical protein
MRVDPSLPIAVFLGPSLDHDAARAMLPANYYPPVRMGDVYRLCTCGVRLIVIIDGVFHGTTPVWQREIVAAMDNGITVVGASSMGALRAIELESFGMIGLGTIVEWYRSGAIEGDDEVALLHAEGEYGYRTLSEPLVNMRWNLTRAADAAVISTGERDSLVAAMQALDYGRRAYPVLFESAAFAALSADAQRALRAFLSARAENLKQIDAARALAWCAARLPQWFAAPASSCDERRTVARHEELIWRGIPGPDHTLPALGTLLAEAAADRARTTHIVNHAARRFYLLDWARAAGVRAPVDVTDAYEQRWVERNSVRDRSAWCAANGITAAELRHEIADRAFEAWLLERGPQACGLDRPFLEAWARAMGIEPPAGLEESVAFRAWLVEKTPNYFGFDRWSVDVAVARELQVSGTIARLAAAHHADALEPTDERADAGARAL